MDTLFAQSALFSKVHPQGPLIDGQATRSSILAALARLERRMSAEREDVAVLHFSGHGALVNGRYYLLPSDVDASDGIGIETTGVEMEAIIRRVRSMSQRGKVLVLVGCVPFRLGHRRRKGTACPQTSMSFARRWPRPGTARLC